VNTAFDGVGGLVEELGSVVVGGETGHRLLSVGMKP